MALDPYRPCEADRGCPMPLEEGAHPSHRGAAGGAYRRAVRPQVQPVPPLQEGRLLHQEARHKPRRGQVQGEEGDPPGRRQGLHIHPGGPGHQAEEVLQGRTDELRRVRVEDEPAATPAPRSRPRRGSTSPSGPSTDSCRSWRRGC